MNCPFCDTAVIGLVTRGPSEHFFEPCGCRAGAATARELMGDDQRAMTDGGVRESLTVYPVSVRVEVAEGEVTWHTSDTAYEQLHNHRTGNLVADIEADATARDGSLFDAVVSASGAYRMTEVDDGEERSK